MELETNRRKTLVLKRCVYSTVHPERVSEPRTAHKGIRMRLEVYHLRTIDIAKAAFPGKLAALNAHLEKN